MEGYFETFNRHLFCKLFLLVITEKEVLTEVTDNRGSPWEVFHFYFYSQNEEKAININSHTRSILAVQLPGQTSKHLQTRLAKAVAIFC